jgi:hypothetical protein
MELFSVVKGFLLLTSMSAIEPHIELGRSDEQHSRAWDALTAYTCQDCLEGKELNV